MTWWWFYNNNSSTNVVYFVWIPGSMPSSIKQRVDILPSHLKCIIRRIHVVMNNTILTNRFPLACMRQCAIQIGAIIRITLYMHRVRFMGGHIFSSYGNDFNRNWNTFLSFLNRESFEAVHSMDKCINTIINVHV